jgi:hypothetical protein
MTGLSQLNPHLWFNNHVLKLLGPRAEESAIGKIFGILLMKGSITKFQSWNATAWCTERAILRPCRLTRRFTHFGLDNYYFNSPFFNIVGIFGWN